VPAAHQGGRGDKSCSFRGWKSAGSPSDPRLIDAGLLLSTFVALAIRATARSDGYLWHLPPGSGTTIETRVRSSADLLSADQVSDLIAFLETLTDDQRLGDPSLSPGSTTCVRGRSYVAQALDLRAADLKVCPPYCGL
jgi:hypothetical protein